MDELTTEFPFTPPPPETTPLITVRRPPILPRWFAVTQAIAVSGLPTNIFVIMVLVLFTNLRVMNDTGTQPTLEFFALLGLIDTALIALLIRVFLMLSGEASRDVFLGQRSVAGEVWRGVLLVPVLLLAVSGIAQGLRYVWPSLHTVEINPLEEYMRTPIDASIFATVAVLAGGVREELTRAFILHRAAQRLGGAWVGLLVYGVVFGCLHAYEGIDIAIAVGLQGLLWGLLYMRRGSLVMSLVSHAGFNAAQVVIAFYSHQT